MKRAILIVSLFLIIIGVGLIEEILLTQNLQELYNKSVSLLNNVESVENVNSTEVITEIEELKSFWDNSENYICIVINHIYIEEVGEQLTKIQTLSNQNKKEEIIVEINLLIYYAQSYQHLIIPTIQNIL